MKKMVFFNAKGGTGKTTLCFNYGWYLSEVRKKKVLLLDVDPQINLVHSFDKGTSNTYGNNLDSLIVNYLKGERIDFSAYKTKINDYIDLLQSSNNISLIDEYLTDYLIKKSVEEGKILKSTYRNLLIIEMLNKIIYELEYDYLLIDSQPNFSLLSTTSIVYTGNVIVVLKPELFSFLDIDYLKKIIKNLNTKFSANIKISGIVINAYESRKKSTKKITQSLIRKYGKELHIYEQKLKYLVSFQNSISLKKEPVFRSYPNSEAAVSMLNLCSQIDKSL